MLTISDLFKEFRLNTNKVRSDNTKTALKYTAISFEFKGIDDMPAVYLKTAEENLGKYLELHGINKNSSKYRNNKNYLSYFIRWAEENSKITLNNKILPEWEVICKIVEESPKITNGYYNNIFHSFCKWASENYLLPDRLTSADISVYGKYLAEDILYGGKKFTCLRHVLKILMEQGTVPCFELPYIGNRPLSEMRYGVKYLKWNDRLKKEYDMYEEWVSAAVKIGRPKKHKQRKVTYINNKARLEQYIGFLVNIKGFDIESLTFENIFTCENIESFLNWLNERLSGITESHKHMLSLFNVIAIKYMKKNDEVKDFLECIDLQVDKRSDKSKRWATLKELFGVVQKIGESVVHAKSPIITAIRFRDRLMFELLVKRALRIRNIIEGEIGKNFYKTSLGEWRIAFSGKDVKASDIDMSFPQDLVPHLEEYINTHREAILNRYSIKVGNILFVSAGKKGLLTRRSVHSIISFYTKKYLGKSVNPHLFRSILATDIIDNAPGGVDSKLICVSNLLAHKNINTTFKHYIKANTRKALMDVDRYLEGLGCENNHTGERELSENIHKYHDFTNSMYEKV